SRASPMSGNWLDPLRRLLFGNPSRAQKKQQRRRPMLVERLEDRLTPAFTVTPNLATHTFEITGDNNGNTLRLLSFTVNGNTSTLSVDDGTGAPAITTNVISATPFTNVSLNLGNGTNKVVVTDTWTFNIGVTYAGGTGSDE